jgi:arsenate reductase-like glutaredoxin family protein
VFFDKFLPKREEIVSDLEKILRENKESCDLGKKASSIFQNLKVLLEIIDLSKTGLLTGDLHPKVIKLCESVFKKALADYDQSTQILTSQSSSDRM